MGTAFICANDPDSLAGICGGDSGGPMVCENEKGEKVQYGITSFAAGGCGSFVQPDGFTKVSTYETFVELF